MGFNIYGVKLKKREETEKTFYLEDGKIPDFRIYMLNIWEQFSKGNDECIKYSNTVEIRLIDEREDKLKLIFKINHGNLYFKYNFKKRLSNLEDSIQKYEEKITGWFPIEKINLDIFNKEVLAFYYKEAYKFKIDELKFIGHEIYFLNWAGHFVTKGNYFEVEGKDLIIEEKRLKQYFKESGWSCSDLMNSKVAIGRTVLEKSNMNFECLEDIKVFLLKIFKDMSLQCLRK